MNEEVRRGIRGEVRICEEKEVRSVSIRDRETKNDSRFSLRLCSSVELAGLRTLRGSERAATVRSTAELKNLETSGRRKSGPSRVRTGVGVSGTSESTPSSLYFLDESRLGRRERGSRGVENDSDIIPARK